MARKTFDGSDVLLEIIILKGYDQVVLISSTKNAYNCTRGKNERVYVFSIRIHNFISNTPTPILSCCCPHIYNKLKKMAQAATKGQTFRKVIGAAVATTGAGGVAYYYQADQGTRRAMKAYQTFYLGTTFHGPKLIL